MPDDAATAQAEVIAFLSDPASYAPRPDRVETIETHGALVFLAGPEAIKIKRAVKLTYLDFSTLERREAACRREFEVNAANAPEIYRAVIPISREANGRLALGGSGDPIEWAVRMARFGQDALLSEVAEREAIDDGLAAALADMVIEAHERAKPAPNMPSVAQLGRVARSVARGIGEASSTLAGAQEQCRRLVDLAVEQLSRSEAILDRRAEAGLVRRCHGDMHLGNIVLWKARPTLFDAIEFDEALATVDLLYDLAFLLMDLDRRGQRRAARIVLDRYLARSGRELDWQGLRALPLFLGLRAAVRSLVAFDRAQVQDETRRYATQQHALTTLDLAIGYLEPPPARLVAVGGLSGTGKTTLAAGLAPLLLPVPGALHLRSDVLRKMLAGVGELDRLPSSAYAPEARSRVYAHMAERAEAVLLAGHSVILDAVFARPEERDAITRLAHRCGVRFDGLWLEADPTMLQVRVAARKGDASDATPEVVEQQLRADLGDIGWRRLDSGGEADDVLAAACNALQIASAAT